MTSTSSNTTLQTSKDGILEGPRRRLNGIRLEEQFSLIGALVASISTTALLFGWLTPLTGAIGFVVVSFLLFLVYYVVLISFSGRREEIKDSIITVLLYSAGVILVSALAFVILFTLSRSGDALPHLNFFTQDMHLAGPLDPLTVGGIQHAIVGTLIQVGIALAITIPLGITTAVFLNEVGGGFARFVRTISDAMTALPSIVAGLFIFSALITPIPALGLKDHGIMGRSGLAAALAISVMMLPIIIRAADVVLRLVPGNLREASYAMGASRWRTIWGVVLPTSRSGLVTAVILGTARGIGETSPVLLTSGATNVMNTDPTNNPMISLPLQVFTFIKSPEPGFIARGFGTAAVLLLLVLSLFAIARVIGGRGPGQLSARQRARAAHRSRLDEMRITLRSHPIDVMSGPQVKPAKKPRIKK
jgi:phosphate transport system permease protein